jgi:hypothetical protein
MNSELSVSVADTGGPTNDDVFHWMKELLIS